MDKSMEKWTVYYSDTIHLGNPDSEVAIVCLWTKKERIIEKLDKADYCYIGQLYSREYGFQILLRNLLANPHIRHLVVVGIDLNNSATGLINFFKEGVGEGNKINGTDVYLDEDFKQEHIALLWERIKIHDLREKKDFKAVGRYIKRLPKLGNLGDKIILPLPRISSPTRYPSDFSGFKARGKDFSSAYIELLKLITRFGVYVPERRRVELPNAMLFFQDFSEEDAKYLKSRRVTRKFRQKPSVVELNGKQYCTFILPKMDCWGELEDFAKIISKNGHKNVCVFISMAHIGEEDLEGAVESIDKSPKGLKWDPDPNGSIVIRLEDAKIKVTHLSPDGRVLEEFSGNSAKEIYRKISSESRVSILYHAFDIGAELQKAEIALKEGKKYVQDRSI